MFTTCYIALGSNLDSPLKQLISATKSIQSLPDTKVTLQSSYYQSKPLGPQDQPDYINQVIEIETALLPLQLLDSLQEIEHQHGRVRERRWGERTLDLDILLYGNQIIQSERLTIPHYDMCNREFVIVPLFEIADTLTLPDGQKLTTLIGKFNNHNMLILS